MKTNFNVSASVEELDKFLMDNPNVELNIPNKAVNAIVKRLINLKDNSFINLINKKMREEKQGVQYSLCGGKLNAVVHIEEIENLNWRDRSDRNVDIDLVIQDYVKQHIKRELYDKVLKECREEFAQKIKEHLTSSRTLENLDFEAERTIRNQIYNIPVSLQNSF